MVDLRSIVIIYSNISSILFIMSAALGGREELRVVQPEWVKNPEETESFNGWLQPHFGPIIQPHVLVRDYFSIFKCLVAESQSQSKSKSKSKSTV